MSSEAAAAAPTPAPQPGPAAKEGGASGRGHHRRHRGGRGHHHHHHNNHPPEGERRKRPDAQHYQPGAFNRGPKGEEESRELDPRPPSTTGGKKSGRKSKSSTPHRPHHSAERPPAPSDQASPSVRPVAETPTTNAIPSNTGPSRSEGPESGSHRAEQAVVRAPPESSSQAGQGQTGGGSRGHKSKRKKPDQVHYVPKKVEPGPEDGSTSSNGPPPPELIPALDVVPHPTPPAAQVGPPPLPPPEAGPQRSNSSNNNRPKTKDKPREPQPPKAPSAGSNRPRGRGPKANHHQGESTGQNGFPEAAPNSQAESGVKKNQNKSGPQRDTPSGAAGGGGGAGQPPPQQREIEDRDMKGGSHNNRTHPRRKEPSGKWVNEDQQQKHIPPRLRDKQFRDGPDESGRGLHRDTTRSAPQDHPGGRNAMPRRSPSPRGHHQRGGKEAHRAGPRHHHPADQSAHPSSQASSEWGHRHFRDSNGGPPHSAGGGGSWDERRGGPKGSKGGPVQVPPKPNLPPRLLRAAAREREHKPAAFAERAPPPVRLQLRPSESDLEDWNDSNRATAHTTPTSTRPPLLSLDSHMSDWSLDLDEEEEQRLMMRRKSSLEQAHHGGGVIRLPQQRPPPLEANPAWRGVPPREVANRGEAGKYLFDPKNPNKPIPAPHHGGGGHVRPPGGAHVGAFRPSMDMSGGGHAHYQPPFAPKMQPRPEWYNNSSPNPKSLGPDIVIRLAQNDFALMEIYQGGRYHLCHLWTSEVKKLRQNIQDALEHLIRTDLNFCAVHNVEFHIWKVAFYQLVEFMKAGLKDDLPDLVTQLEHNINELLEEGLDFYIHLLDVLDRQYRLGLEVYYDVLEPRPVDKYVKLALMSAQKCLLCLGDLSRYREHIQDTSSYGKARQYYQKASNLEPRNGRPFNQLGILALNTKRKFEAVYYNMRCLMSKNPFPSSKESLAIIFEEIKRKWEASERKRVEERLSRKRASDKELEGGQLIKGTRLRREIWTRPEGGGRRLHRTTSALETPEGGWGEEEELRHLSTSDLNRRFNNTFLYLVGKLHSHINMESFAIALELMKKEFRELLARIPLPLDSKRLVQIMALNMFVIEQTRMKGGDAESYRLAAQASALQLAFEMFGLLVERSNLLLQSFKPQLESSSQCIFPNDDLPTLLSAVKVWCDWLLGNNDTWFPIVCDEPFSHLATLATHLEKLKPTLKPILDSFLDEAEFARHPRGRDNYELIKLGEDAILCDFNPWFRGLTWEVYRRYAPKALPSALALDARRIDALNFCVDFLEGLEPPILKWSMPDNAHISLVEPPISAQEKANLNLTHLIESEEDILEESYSDDDEHHAPSLPNTHAHGAAAGQVSALKHRKHELERQKLAEEREARRMQRQILSEHVNVTLEVCPRFIVADTNCFVDHLPDLQALAGSNQFHLRIPLVVLNELEGLAKGARPHKYASPEHAAMVSQNARSALQFLHEQRHTSIKCVTSKGTLLPTMGVTNEEDNSEGKNNDDLILDTCLAMATATPQRTTSAVEERGGPMRTVKREVVLLTDDRNLKLKSHVHDIPVNKLKDFVRWAQQ